jgi:hypothetical protein
MRARSIMTLFIIAVLSLAAASPGQVNSVSSRWDAGLRQIAASLGQEVSPEVPIKCGFSILASLRHQVHPLSPEIESAAGLLQYRPVLQTSILRSGCRVHFDTTGTDAPALLDAQGARIPGTALAFAESTAAVLAHVEAVEVGEMGYPAPVEDGTEGGGPELDIYIVELGYSYGYTNADGDVPAGGRASSYITIDNDFAFVRPVANRGIPALKVTIAHEFHHVIQIGSYGLWPDDSYFYEITSTWMEDVVYTEVNDYYSYLRSDYSQFKSPGVAFTSNGMIDYSRAIWAHFIAKAYGDVMMRRTWEFIRDQRPLIAVDAALREGGSSFALAFTEWARWNFYTGSRADSIKYYPEGANYPEMVQLPHDFGAPSTTIAGTVDPTGMRYHQIFVPHSAGGTDTLTIGAVNCDLTSALVSSPPAQSYTLDLRTDQPDATYKQTGAGIYAKFSAGDLPLWSIWFFVGGNSVLPSGLGSLKEGTAFPNPWFADGKSSVSIPVDATTPLMGQLQVYDAAMHRVYSSGDIPSTGATRQLFTWDGITSSGRVAATGVYVYYLSLSDGRTVKGKLAIIRR